jgi:hypothetical protein
MPTQTLWNAYCSFRSHLLVRIVGTVLPVIRRFYKLQPFPFSHEQLRLMPAGSLGWTVARYLDNRGFELVEAYEIHDIKHLLYGYEMTAEGEVRLQCFLFGTGNYSLPVLGTMALGFVLMPDMWLHFAFDLLRGRFSGCVADPNFNHILPLPLHDAQKEAGIHDYRTIPLMPTEGERVVVYA